MTAFVAERQQRGRGKRAALYLNAKKRKGRNAKAQKGRAQLKFHDSPEVRIRLLVQAFCQTKASPTKVSGASVPCENTFASNLRKCADFKTSQRAVQPLQLSVRGQQRGLLCRRRGKDDGVRQFDGTLVSQSVHAGGEFKVGEAQVNHLDLAAKFIKQIPVSFGQAGESGELQCRDDRYAQPAGMFCQFCEAGMARKQRDDRVGVE